MEFFEVILSIFASALSIVATVVALKSKEEVKSLRNLYEGNKQTASGGGNAQVMGDGNQVSTRVK